MLDINGSFHVSTADYLKLNDGVKFYADTSQPVILTSSTLQAFGFISPDSHSEANIELNNTRLSVPEGKSITLLGQDISLSGSLLTAPGGQISIVSIDESGEITYSDQGLDTSAISQLGHLSVETTGFQVNGEQQGNLQILGSDIEINTKDTDFVSSVSVLKASFFEDADLLEKPCELAGYFGYGQLTFTVDTEEEETRYGLEVKKNKSRALGDPGKADCL